MPNAVQWTVALSVMGLLAPAALTPLHAAPVITNGGFEAGFSGWTRVDQLGSEGTFFVQSGTASPVNGDPVPLPSQGSNAAMTDAGGPGAHVLYQDFVSDGSALLVQFDLFLGNRADRYATPATLDFATPTLNQQARVDILRAGADPFSVAAADVLMTLYRSEVGSPLVTGYVGLSYDISALLAAQNGQTLRLRFAETDNVGPFQFGVDNVRLSPVPELPTHLLVSLGLLAIGAARVRGGQARGGR